MTQSCDDSLSYHLLDSSAFKFLISTQDYKDILI